MRRVEDKDFVGKTIKSIDCDCDNYIEFGFSDGTSLMIQSELIRNQAVIAVED